MSETDYETPTEQMQAHDQTPPDSTSAGNERVQNYNLVEGKEALLCRVCIKPITKKKHNFPGEVALLLYSLDLSKGTFYLITIAQIKSIFVKIQQNCVNQFVVVVSGR